MFLINVSFRSTPYKNAGTFGVTYAGYVTAFGIGVICVEYPDPVQSAGSSDSTLNHAYVPGVHVSSW